MSRPRVDDDVMYMIMKQLALDISCVPSETGLRRLPKYASVCKDWQNYFERFTFRSLRLQKTCLDEFGKIVARRQGNLPSLEHISLHVDLDAYACWMERFGSPEWNCATPESDEEYYRNNVHFTNATYKMLHILSSIQRDEASSKSGLTFEFSASSPDDNKHWFPSCSSLRDLFPHSEDTGVQYQTLARLGQLISPASPHLDITGDDPSAEAHDDFKRSCAKRLIRPLRFDFRELLPSERANDHVRLPEVKAVTEFLVRREFHRDVTTPTLAKLLKESLTCVESLKRDNWRVVTKSARRKDDRHYAPRVEANLLQANNYFLSSVLPKSLKTLNLFENFRPEFHGDKDTQSPRSSRLQILPSLAVSAPNLERLSVSFLTDAIDCLGLRSHLGRPDIVDHVSAYLPNLRSVALTSQEFLRPAQDVQSTEIAISNLLQAAAAAATKMPRLEVMEIWNWEHEPWEDQEGGRACVFRYEAASTSEALRGGPGLTWSTNWGVEEATIDSRAVEAWDAVARSSPRYIPFREPLSVVRDPLANLRYRTYATVALQMRLYDLVLVPRSLLHALFDFYC